MISLIISDSTLCEDKIPKKKSDCLDYELTDEEKTEGEDTCCYMTYKDENDVDSKGCTNEKKKALTQTIIDLYAALNGYTDVKVDCHSNWLTSGFALLLLVLF